MFYEGRIDGRRRRSKRKGISIGYFVRKEKQVCPLEFKFSGLARQGEIAAPIRSRRPLQRGVQ